MALVALLYLAHIQIWMQPMALFRLQMLQEEAIASCVFNIWPQSTTGQNRTNDALKKTESFLSYGVYIINKLQNVHVHSP